MLKHTLTKFTLIAFGIFVGVVVLSTQNFGINGDTIYNANASISAKEFNTSKGYLTSSDLATGRFESIIEDLNSDETSDDYGNGLIGQVSTSNDIIEQAIAMGQDIISQGIPYVWGKCSLSEGFDCSGFTWYCYKNAGYGFSDSKESSRDLYNYGTEVPVNLESFDGLERGDLLFKSYDGTQKRIHHVAIYIGNGTIMEAMGAQYGIVEKSYSKPGDWIRSTETLLAKRLF